MDILSSVGASCARDPTEKTLTYVNENQSQNRKLNRPAEKPVRSSAIYCALDIRKPHITSKSLKCECIFRFGITIDISHPWCENPYLSTITKALEVLANAVVLLCASRHRV